MYYLSYKFSIKKFEFEILYHKGLFKRLFLEKHIDTPQIL